jgi:hypothetical protein
VQRFRVLGFYVAGVVVIVGLTIGGVSIRRSAAEAETPQASDEQPVAMSIPAPEFERGDKAEGWINTKPLKLQDLRGQVVVVHFWTFG